jgi:hypothetical protein
MDEETPICVAESVTDPAITALRQKLLGGKVTIPQIAAACEVGERAVYNWFERYRIPYVVIPGIGRAADPEDVRLAVTREANAPSRGRGRPRKTAA